MFAYIARQPIYDREKKVAGYELLYRDGTGGNSAKVVDGDAATRSVLHDAMTVFGLQQLTNKLPAYINFTRNLLLSDFALLASPKEIVVEVMGDIEVDAQLIAKLGELKRGGYKLALEDYDGSFKYQKVTQLFDIVRVNVQKYNELQLKELVKKVGMGRIRLLAERVETLDDFATARAAGFVLFQGYFFEKPTFLSKRIPSLAASTYGRLLHELLAEEPDFGRCSEIIQSDVLLTYMFMRRAQTANYYRGNMVTEIRQGLVLMGTEELRRWVCLVMLKQSNVTHSDELPKKAYLRGRFIERLMENSRTRLDPRQGFLMGMFSLLDQVMGVQLESLLEELRLTPAVKAALLGREENEYAIYLQYVVIYEMANERLILPDIHLRIDEDEVLALYMKCIEDADLAFYRLG